MLVHNMIVLILEYDEFTLVYSALLRITTYTYMKGPLATSGRLIMDLPQDHSSKTLIQA